LLNPTAQDLVTLNELGSAVWLLLHEPQDASSIGRMLSARWPHVAEDVILSDVRRFLATLEAQGLVERVC
jgi:hypothetical protein